MVTLTKQYHAMQGKFGFGAGENLPNLTPKSLQYRVNSWTLFHFGSHIGKRGGYSV
jgi:hypothetical protein